MTTNDRNSVAVDRGWLIVLRDLGIDPHNVLRRAELPLDLVFQETVRLSVEEYFRLWIAVDAEAGDPTLPIRIGSVISVEAFHPMIFAALCSPDLSVAVRRIATYKRLVAPMTLKVEDREEGLFVGM
jgi:hypothetical protein